jgi:hypothetical protein
MTPTPVASPPAEQVRRTPEQEAARAVRLAALAAKEKKAERGRFWNSPLVQARRERQLDEEDRRAAEEAEAREARLPHRVEQAAKQHRAAQRRADDLKRHHADLKMQHEAAIARAKRGE